MLCLCSSSDGAPAAAATTDKAGRVKQMFSRLAGSDGEIDSEELQDVLTVSLKQGILDYYVCILLLIQVSEWGGFNYQYMTARGIQTHLYCKGCHRIRIWCFYSQSYYNVSLL